MLNVPFAISVIRSMVMVTILILILNIDLYAIIAVSGPNQFELHYH